MSKQLFISSDSEKQALLIFTDGGARGNPGPGAVGFVVKDNTGKVLTEQGKYIGHVTNNVAEYQAVIEALKWLKNNLINSVNSINFFLDSKLVVNQLNGYYKIKNANLRNLIIEVRKLEREIGGNVSYCYLAREKNFQADFLVNQTLAKRDP